MKTTEKYVKIPLLNANETEVLVTELFVSLGSKIEKGDLVASIESTKSSQDIESEHAGYIQKINFSEGQYANVGDILFLITEKFNPDYKKNEKPKEKTLNLKISEPALAFAKENNIDIKKINPNQFITISYLKTILPKQKILLDNEQIKENSLVIIGGGGHCKALIELIQAEKKFHILGILDDKYPVISSVLDIPVIGDTNIMQRLHTNGLRMAINAVGGISNINTRIKVNQKIVDAGLTIPTVIHPTAYVEPSAKLAAGIQIFPHAYIGSDVKILANTIVNTGVIISHDCVIGEMTNLSPGAILAGDVTIGKNCLIGMGVTINLGVQIGDRCKVGNSAVIKSSLTANTIVHAGSTFPS